VTDYELEVKSTHLRKPAIAKNVSVARYGQNGRQEEKQGSNVD